MPDHLTQQDIEVVLGFDFGLRRIGVAVGQTITHSASAVTTLDAEDGVPDWDAIAKLIRQWHPQAIIVGLPLHKDGRSSDISVRATDFGEQLKEKFHLPIIMVDERLSSVAAEAMIESSTSMKKKTKRTKATVDKLAAAVIVESWLNDK